MAIPLIKLPIVVIEFLILYDPCSMLDRWDRDPIAAGLFMESDRTEKSWKTD